MILLDTETTGLIGNPSLPLSQQPEIIEIGALRLDDETLEEVGEPFLTFVRPRILPLDPKITKITGITSEMLLNQPSFSAVFGALANYFRGEKTVVAHNASFDVGMLTLELRRLDRITKFPWPTAHICTVEASQSIKGHRLKLAELYALATGGLSPDVKHRAIDDCRSLAVCVRWLRGRGEL